METREAFIPKNPVELAQPYAQELCLQPKFIEFTRTPAEERLLGELNEAASSMDMLGTSYFIEAGLAYRIPHYTDSDREISTTYTKFSEGLTFEGNFCTHAILKIDRIIGREESVRALCLTFDEANLLPFFDTLDEDSMLYVPVLAIDPDQVFETA